MQVLFVFVLVFGEAEDATLRPLMLLIGRDMHLLGVAELGLSRYRSGAARVGDLNVDGLRAGGRDEVYGHTWASGVSFNIARTFSRGSGQNVGRMRLALVVLKIGEVVVVGGL